MYGREDLVPFDSQDSITFQITLPPKYPGMPPQAIYHRPTTTTANGGRCTSQRFDAGFINKFIRVGEEDHLLHVQTQMLNESQDSSWSRGCEH